MTQVTPTFKEILDAEEFLRQRREGRASIRLQRRKKSIIAGHEYLITEHWYQYMHGDHKIGKPVKMLGREARYRNRNLEDKFYKDKDPKARMGHWYWLGKPCEEWLGEGMLDRQSTIGVKADD